MPICRVGHHYEGHSQCPICQAVYNERNQHRLQLQRYSLTPSDYRQMLEKQNHVCAICGEPETTKRNGRIIHLAIDHDHETGKVRGLLCKRCNTVLGWYERHQEAARQYLAGE